MWPFKVNCTNTDMHIQLLTLVFSPICMCMHVNVHGTCKLRETTLALFFLIFFANQMYRSTRLHAEQNTACNQLLPRCLTWFFLAHCDLTYMKNNKSKDEAVLIFLNNQYGGNCLNGHTNSEHNIFTSLRLLELPSFSISKYLMKQEIQPAFLQIMKYTVQNTAEFMLGFHRYSLNINKYIVFHLHINI